MNSVPVTASIAQQHQEEEEGRSSVEGDLSRYEFKILRTGIGSHQFRDPGRLRQILAEEAIAGWELHEKLDNMRIRLRRPISCRAKDALLTQDPYRTIDPRELRRMRIGILICLMVCFLLSFILVSLLAWTGGGRP